MPRTTCYICGSSDLRPSAARRSDYRCTPCATAATRAYRASRAAKGIRTHPTPEAEARRWQAAKADPVERTKWLARVRARQAIRRGKLFRQPCEVCGTLPVEAHHDDYSQPLSVRWLCPTHHREHHAVERATRRAA